MKRAYQRSIARERMFTSRRMNKKYFADGVYASYFARNWRMVLGMAPNPLKKTRAASIRYAPKKPAADLDGNPPAKRSVFQKIRDFLRRPVPAQI